MKRTIILLAVVVAVVSSVIVVLQRRPASLSIDIGSSATEGVSYSIGTFSNLPVDKKIELKTGNYRLSVQGPKIATTTQTVKLKPGNNTITVSVSPLSAEQLVSGWLSEKNLAFVVIRAEYFEPGRLVAVMLRSGTADSTEFHIVARLENGLWIREIDLQTATELQLSSLPAAERSYINQPIYEEEIDE